MSLMYDLGAILANVMLSSRRHLFLPFLLLIAPLWPSPASAQQTLPADDKSQASPSAVHDETEIPLEAKQPEPSGPALREIRIPRYASCPLEELRRAVPELAHLKSMADQSQLTAVLDKIGTTMLEIVRKTPNLISDEAVATDQAGVKSKQNYSFLVVRHEGMAGSIFDEYRVDPATGHKFETSANVAEVGSAPSELPSVHAADLNSYGAPASQGFASDWLHFYPANRGLSDFRYLGEQDMDGHHTLVVAFSQKPERVQVPATVSYGERTFNLYRQGVAWVDASDFRIVRLRTDILSAPHGVPLRQLTADIQFTQVVIAQVADPLWLPHEVSITASLAGTLTHETHVYTKHRLFHAQPKILLNP